MCKILYLEDSPVLRRNMVDIFKEEFREDGIDVIACRTVYDAVEEWMDQKDSIYAIVLDVMLSPLGLPNEQLIRQAKDGILTGWIWLWNCLNPKQDLPHPADDKKIAIYSGYLEELDRYLQSNDATENERLFAKGIKKIKKSIGSSETELIEYIKAR